MLLGNASIISAFPVEVAVRHIYRQHRNLACVLSAVERQLAAAEEKHLIPDLLPAAGLLYYLREFHQGTHRSAEEAFLFSAMRRGEASREVFCATMEEHGIADDKLAALEAALADCRRHPEKSPSLFRALLADYGGLQRNHMAFEESVVLPAAVDLLPADDWLPVAEAFSAHVDPLFDRDPEPKLQPLKQLLQTIRR